MSATVRRLLLRANALYLLVAAAGGLVSDLRGAFFGAGPVGVIVGGTPQAAIGFIEAHGLALIIGVLLWRAELTRAWHLAAAAVHVLLGTANVVFWPIFIAADMLVVGYVTTALHAAFALLQLLAVATTVAIAPASRHGEPALAK